MIELSKVKLTASQKKAASETLRNWGTLSKVLKKSSREEVRRLLAFELETLCRLSVVQRLTARYGVLEQQTNEREVASLLAKRWGAR